MVFAFNLGDWVSIRCSGEDGEVLGRAEYSRGERAYYIRYAAADGRATEAWWGESALVSEPV
jgi:hypothetical protein